MRRATGFCLRRDIHSLLDAGYVTVTPDLYFESVGGIKEEFDNGRHYYAMHGETIHVPRKASSNPIRGLRWHNEHCFRD